MNYHGFVVNRALDVKRWQSVSKTLGSFGVDFSIVFAHESSDHPGDALKESFVDCLKIARRLDIPYATLIEDDVIFRKFEWIEEAFRQLPPDWDLFYPYFWENFSDEVPEKIEVRPIESNICTHFMMVNRKFFDDAIFAYERTPGVPVDKVFHSSAGIKIYATNYNLAGQDAGVSTLDGKTKGVRFCGDKEES